MTGLQSNYKAKYKKSTTSTSVQKGSNGGPIYDEKGNIIGIIVSQLDMLKVAEAVGS